jgi:glycosyltransferase involved in cell wall biosynthesis
VAVAATSRHVRETAVDRSGHSDALVVFVTGLYEPTGRDSVAIQTRDYIVGLHEIGAPVAVLDMMSQGAFSTLFNLARTVVMLATAYGRERLGIRVARQLLRWRRVLLPAIAVLRYVKRRGAGGSNGSAAAAQHQQDGSDRAIVKKLLLSPERSPVSAKSVVCVVTGYDLLYAPEWGAVLKQAIAVRLAACCPGLEEIRWVVNVLNESTRVASALRRGVEFFDEVWVPAEFQVNALAASGARCRRIAKIAGAVELATFHPDVTPLALPGRRRFCFLTLSQYVPERVQPAARRQDLHDLARLWNHARKAADLLIRAFLAEFAADEDVCLAIKTTHDPNSLRSAVERILCELGYPANRASQLVLLGNWTPPEELPRLYAAADAFVLVSRGEGWGRPLAEAMAMAKPTIATNFGGNTEFMNSDNSYLVECDIVPVAAVIGRKFEALGEWAEPSFDDLRRTLREVFEDADRATAKGRRAAQDIRATLGRPAVARAIRTRVDGLLPH